MRFSQRIGRSEAKIQVQLDDVDNDLKNRLWNLVYAVLNKIDENSQGKFIILTNLIWNQFYKLPLDEKPYYLHDVVQSFKEKFFSGNPFNSIYDLIEFLADIGDYHIGSEHFIEMANTVLEEEKSGYRFIGKKLTPITSDIEIEEIKDSIEKTKLDNEYDPVYIHIKSAIEKFSDRKNPDYRNSIKESISAIESLAKILSNDKKATLKSALDKLSNKIEIHPKLILGFKNIYDFTSDDMGIRHALLEKDKITFDDAKFFLVSSSAFINYLVSLAEKAKIT